MLGNICLHMFKTLIIGNHLNLKTVNTLVDNGIDQNGMCHVKDDLWHSDPL